MNQLFSDNAYTLLVVAVALELNNAVSEREKGIVRTNAYIGAGMYVCTSLTNDDITCENGLTVGLLNAKSLRTAITAVLSRTYTFFMCKKLQAKSQHNCSTSIFNVFVTVLNRFFLCFDIQIIAVILEHIHQLIEITLDQTGNSVLLLI